MSEPSVTPPISGSPSRGAPYQPLLWTAVAAGLGVAADRALVGGGAWAVVVWWAMSAIALAASTLLGKRSEEGRATAACLVAVACLGGAWHHWRWNLVETNDLACFCRDAPEPACVAGVLVEPVRLLAPPARNPLRAFPAPATSEATLDLRAIRNGKSWRAATGLCRMRVAGELRGPIVGDQVKVFARMARPPQVMNPGQRDWAAIEQAYGRRSELYSSDPACVTVTKHAGPFSTGAWIDRARQHCEAQLAACVGPRDEPLALAVMLGARDKLDDATIDAFVHTGTIHFLVVSGSNLAMLAAIVWQAARLAGWSTRRQRLATLFAVVAYTALVGPQPPMVRAAILATATLAALTTGRRTAAGNILGGAALAVMALNPSELFRGGTQLSFLSVAVLTPVARWLVRREPTDPLDQLLAAAAPWPVRAAKTVGLYAFGLVAASMAVWLATSPLAAHHFHTIAPAGILLTPIIWPLVGVGLAATFGALTLGWLVPWTGAIFGWVCGQSLHWADWVVKQAQELPGSPIYTAGPTTWWLCGFYGAFGLWAAIPRLRPRWTWQASALCLWMALGYGLHGAGRVSDGELRTTFLAVGHGTCAVMELPSGQTVLYDAGALGSPDQVTDIVSYFLWERGIDRIDQLVLSHADVDHYNAVPGLVERFPVGVIYVSPLMFDPLVLGGEMGAPNYLRDFLVEHDVPMREIWLGDRLPTLDERVTMEVLHPPHDGVEGRDNANSVLLAVEFAGKRLLLPGDLESPGIELVMNDPPVDCDVLLAPHHGSEQSDPPGFAAWCRPEEVVMSGRRPARPLASKVSYERAGARVHHTAYTGAETCLLSAEGIEVSEFRPSVAKQP